MPKQAVLLVAHGTPETIEQIPEYLRNVVSGRPMPQYVIEEIQHRYSLIGRSPLTEITREQGNLVQGQLGAAGKPVPVISGCNWRPIPDVVREMRADGVGGRGRLPGSVANQRRPLSTAVRLRLARSHRFTDSWAEHPLRGAFAERLRRPSRVSAAVGGPVPVLFTAHSVPTRTIEPPASDAKEPRLWPGEGADPYADDARRTAQMVAGLVPEIPRWWFAFQSQGASGGPWIGPTVEETLDSIAAEGVKTLVLQPIGFLCDHVEILYDVDIAFKEYAGHLGIRLERPESLNRSMTLARAIADLAVKGLSRLSPA
jgi:ferrochelatase